MIDIAVMVEPRLHEYLIPVIENIIRNTDIPILIFHSKDNEDILKNTFCNNSRIFFNRLRQTNLTIKQYNILLTSLDFWNKIDGENILIFQTDSCLCRHINTFDFTQYLNYGFIGAPSKLEYPIPWQNGGISIRKKSLMIKSIKHNNGPSDMHEDKFYTVAKRRIVNPSSFELAKQFSVEQYYYDNPLAIHKAWKYLSKEDWNSLKQKFPEISLTFNNL